MPIQGFIFDLDGTLGNTLPICVAAFQNMYAELRGETISETAITDLFGPSEEGIVARLFPDHPQALDRYLAHYAELHRRAPLLFPGLRAAIDLLRERGVRMAIVTGKGARSLDISLAEMGLTDCGFRLSPGYPDRMDKPRGIAEVLAAWGLPGDQVAYLGDTPYDMQAARQMGLMALGAAWAETATVQTVNHGSTDALFFQVADFVTWIEAHIPVEQV